VCGASELAGGGRAVEPAWRSRPPPVMSAGPVGRQSSVDQRAGGKSCRYFRWSRRPTAGGAAEPAGRSSRQAGGARRSATRLAEPPTGLAEPPSWHARSFRADRRSRRAGRRSRPPPAGRASERAGRAAELVGGASKLVPSQRGALNADLGKTQGFFWAARLVDFVAGARRGADRPNCSIAAHHRSCSCVFSVPWAAIEQLGRLSAPRAYDAAELCKMLMCIDYDVTYETRCVS